MDQDKSNQTFKIESHTEALFWASISQLRALIEDPDITEIAINGDEPYVFTSGVGGRKKHDIKIDQAQIEVAIKTLAHFNEKDATKKSDSIISQKIGDLRVTGVLAPVSYKGHLLRIRKHTMSDMSLDDMVANSSITESQKLKLIEIVEMGANFLVAGGTASGKTTSLNAMLAYIPQHESIVCIENGIELKIKSIDNTRLLEFPEYGIGCDTLLHTTLRLSPDRIIVGELRKPDEAATFLDVMGAGHDGCTATIHANSARLTLMRFDSMVASKVQDSILSIRSRTASVLEYVVHFHKDKRTHKRCLSGIVKVVGLDKNGEYILEDVI